MWLPALSVSNSTSRNVPLLAAARRVGASELEGLGTGSGVEAKGISEGRVTRTRKIRAPRRAPGDELQ